MPKCKSAETVEFDIGEPVRLTSGGQIMTVETLVQSEDPDELERFRCVWFNGSQLERRDFYPSMLESAE